MHKYEKKTKKLLELRDDGVCVSSAFTLSIHPTKQKRGLFKPLYKSKRRAAVRLNESYPPLQ